MSAEPEKLKPIRANEWGPYRGEWRLGWRRTRGPVDELAIQCRHCDQWWGWTWDIERARRVLARMDARGCPRCGKKRRKAKR